MTHVYRISPKEEKAVEAIYHVYNKDVDGNIRSWSVTETYENGIGYREMNDPVYLDDTTIIVENAVGLGSELIDICGCWFEFDESFTDEEQKEIKEMWEKEGPTWLFDGDHTWQVEEERIIMYGPYKVDIIDDATGKMIIESVKLNHSDELI